MINNRGNTKIIVTVSVLVIMALTWFTFSKPKTQEGEIIQYGDGAQMSEIEKDMINMLSTVGKIEINDELFKNKAFSVLQDRSRAITEEPIGRPNPFAPIDYAAVLDAQDNLQAGNLENADGRDGATNNFDSVNLQAREQN